MGDVSVPVPDYLLQPEASGLLAVSAWGMGGQAGSYLAAKQGGWCKASNQAVSCIGGLTVWEQRIRLVQVVQGG